MKAAACLFINVIILFILLIKSSVLCVHRATGLWRDSRWTVRVWPRFCLVSPIFLLWAWWPGSPPSSRRRGRSAGRVPYSRRSGACCVHLTLPRERWAAAATPDWASERIVPTAGVHVEYLPNTRFVVMMNAVLEAAVMSCTNPSAFPLMSFDAAFSCRVKMLRNISSFKNACTRFVSSFWFVGVRSGEELGSDDAHHHRHGGRSDHQTGLQPGSGGRQPAVWRGALVPERLPRLPQW